MRTLVTVLISLLSAASTLAATAPTPPSGGAAVTHDGKVAISRGACAKVMREAREGADYVPGVDVNGRAVAPADLPAAPGAASQPSFTISLDLNLRQRYGIPANARLFRPQAEVGDITVQGSTVLFNGEPIGTNEASLLIAECRAHGFAPK